MTTGRADPPPPRTGHWVRALQVTVSGAGSVSLTALPIYIAGTNGAAAVGLSVAFLTAARLAALPLVGWLGDRWQPLRLLRLALATAAAGIAVSVVGAPVSVLWVCVGAVFGGAGLAFYLPAVRLLLARRLAPKALRRVFGDVNAIDNLLALIGPTIAALIMVAASAKLAVAVTGVGYLLGLLLLRDARRWDQGPPPVNEATPRVALARVLRALREHPWFIAGTVQCFLQVVLGFAPAFILTRTVVIEGLGEAALAPLLTAATAGGLLGAVLAGRWTPARPGLVANLGFLSYAAVGLCLATDAPYFAFTAALAVGTGLTAFHGVWWYAAVMEAFPEGIRGRVLALNLTATGLLEPAAMAITIPVTDAVGLALVGAVMTGVFVVCPLATLLVPGFVRYAPPQPTMHRGSPSSPITS